MSEDLTLLIEKHQKEIWEWKMKESEWIKTQNQLEGNKKIIEELSTKMVELGKTNLSLKAKIQELESTLTSAQGINDDHQRYNGRLQTQLTEALEDNKKLAMQIADMNSRKM